MALSDIAANKAKELATNLLQDAQGQIATSRSQISYSNAIEKSKASIESARLTQEELQKIISLNSGSPWPQIKPDSAVGGKMGFYLLFYYNQLYKQDLLKVKLMRVEDLEVKL